MAYIRASKSGGGGGSSSFYADTTKSPLYTMNQRGDTWTATQDCIMIGTVAGSNAPYVFINGNTSSDYLVNATAGSGQSRSAVIGNLAQGIGMAIPKGSVITSRSDSGSFDLKFYETL